jgi:outer membrane lipoprotein SlyB
MKKFLFILPLIAISACSATERGAAYGGLGGAAIGGIVSGDVGGAVVGGAIGAVAGAVIGQCRYQGRHERTYIARCPAGY